MKPLRVFFFFAVSDEYLLGFFFYLFYLLEFFFYLRSINQ